MASLPPPPLIVIGTSPTLAPITLSIALGARKARVDASRKPSGLRFGTPGAVYDHRWRIKLRCRRNASPRRPTRSVRAFRRRESAVDLARPLPAALVRRLPRERCDTGPDSRFEQVNVTTRRAINRGRDCCAHWYERGYSQRQDPARQRSRDGGNRGCGRVCGAGLLGSWIGGGARFYRDPPRSGSAS